MNKIARSFLYLKNKEFSNTCIGILYIRFMLLQNVSVLLGMERWCELEHFTKQNIWLLMIFCTFGYSLLNCVHTCNTSIFIIIFMKIQTGAKKSVERVFPPINHNICIYNFHIDWNSHLQNFTRLSTGLKPVCLEFSIISQKHPTYN